MRVPYVPNPPPTNTPEEAAIVARVEARRKPRPLQPLDLALLHSPPVADGWNSFLGAVRTQTSLGDDIRELAISRVAVCNRAWYEWTHHAPLAVKGGVSETALEAVKRDVLGERPAELNERQWAVLVFTDEMTRNVQVKDETFALLKSLFSDQEVVEITATVACYNCVSRFLVALDGKSNCESSVSFWSNPNGLYSWGEEWNGPRRSVWSLSASEACSVGVVVEVKGIRGRGSAHRVRRKQEGVVGINKIVQARGRSKGVSYLSEVMWCEMTGNSWGFSQCTLVKHLS
jgi:alkylhydroperoxidase family enzyme